jgi:hypothetical protein
MPRRKPPPTVEAVLAWSRGWHAERRTWPHEGSGPVPGAPGETWKGIDWALPQGLRGLPGETSLADLLHRERGFVGKFHALRLNVRDIRSRRAFSLHPGAVADNAGWSWHGQTAALAAMPRPRNVPGTGSLARSGKGSRVVLSYMHPVMNGTSIQKCHCRAELRTSIPLVDERDEHGAVRP